MSRRGRVPTHTMLTSSVRLATVIRIIRKPSSVLTARRVHHQHHTQARLLAGPSDAQQFGSAVQSLRSVLPRRPCVRFPARGDCHPFPQPAGSCGHQYVFLAVRHSCTGDSRSTDGLWAALGRTRTAGGIRFNQQPREHESAIERLWRIVEAIGSARQLQRKKEFRFTPRRCAIIPHRVLARVAIRERDRRCAVGKRRLHPTRAEDLRGPL
jgi:hypothetical protein